MQSVFRLTVLAILFLFPIVVLAQEYDIPKNYQLKAKEDYAKYENDVVASVNFLENSPLNKNIEKRKRVNAFLLKWISGSPSVHISIEPYVMDLTKKNPDFLMLFMGGWTRFSIKNPDNTDVLEGHLAGLHCIMKIYENNIGVNKDKNIKKLIEKDKNGDLKEWLIKQLKKKKS